MKLPVLFALALVTGHAAAQDWFTIYGYPELPGTDMIQISPVISAWQQQTTLEVRVTRKVERQGYRGITYRSYAGMAAIDCSSRKGWFLTLNFYRQPDWAGEPAAVVSDFRPEEAPMAFADIPGAPSVRLIAAACAAAR